MKSFFLDQHSRTILATFHTIKAYTAFKLLLLVYVMILDPTWRPFAMIGTALCVGTMGTALASPLYPLYQQLWGLQASHITILFMTYMFGCLVTLLFLGRLSNAIGFIRVMLIGLILVILGSILSAIAQHPIYLAVGRFFIGIASGLLTTSAMLGLIQSIPEHLKTQAPQMSSMITVIGFALGPLLGGVIAQWLPYPLISPYIPVILLSVLCCIGLSGLNIQSPKNPQLLSFAPHLEQPRSPFKGLFHVVSITAFTVFALFSLYASLAPSFIEEILPWHGPLVSGAAITGMLLISGLAQFFAKSMGKHKLLKYGLMSLSLSCISLILCIYFNIPALFFLSDILAGIGHGMCLLGAFAMIHEITQTENRAAVLSTYLFIAYLGTILPIIVVGYLADYLGLKTAVVIFSIAMGLLSGLLLILHQQAKKRLACNA